MENHALLPQFTGVFTELRDFSRVVEQSLLTRNARPDPKEFIEAFYFIHYQLLSNGPVDRVSNGSLFNGNDDVQETFRLGAIIYTKGIPMSKFKTFLGLIIITHEADLTSSSLLSWLLLVGGVASAKNNMDRTLSIAYIVRLRRVLVVDEWEVAKERLEGVL